MTTRKGRNRDLLMIGASNAREQRTDRVAGRRDRLRWHQPSLWPVAE